MAWYRTGTVGVTINSNAVIGTGTAFIANCRVGDGFLGPDGRWYEVTNVASDTALSIAPNYLGPTGASGTFAIAPLQGYPKALADAFNTINNQWGAQLAALKTTGNYDTLPVSKGGTGGTDQATARSSLGVVKQSSITDATAGSLLVVGAFGGNGGPSIPCLNTVDANSLVVAATYSFANNGINLPEPYCYIRVTNVAAGIVKHESMGMLTNKRYERFLNNSVWSPWQLQAAAGANSDITSLSAITTALSVAQGGTGGTSIAALITQLLSGGIIESGLVNGCYYTKFADGSLINRRKATIGGGIQTAKGSLFVSIGLDFLNFAVPFVGDYEMFSYGISSTAGGGWAGQQVYGSTGTTWGTWAAYNPVSTTGNVDLAVAAFGRWKA